MSSMAFGIAAHRLRGKAAQTKLNVPKRRY